MIPGASPTRFFKEVEQECQKNGIECPVKLKTLKNKAGIWRSKGEVPPAQGLGLEGGRGSVSHREKKSKPESGFVVENSSPLDSKLTKSEQLLDAAKQRRDVAQEEWNAVLENHSNQTTHVVTDEELEAFQTAIDSVREWQTLATQLAEEVTRLQEKDSTQSTNDLNPVLEIASRLSDSGSGSGPKLDESIPPPIDFNWHKGIPLDSKEREDANQIGRLIDAIGLIQKEYAFTGIWGPHEWTSILAGLNRLTACASAQRRFKPGSQPGPVIDIG